MSFIAMSGAKSISGERCESLRSGRKDPPCPAATEQRWRG